MRLTGRWLALCVVLTCLGGTAALADGPDITSPEELRQLLVDKKFHDVIKKASYALGINGDAGKGLDRYALFMAKAEAQLQTRQTSEAVESFNLAAKEARTPQDAAIAIATAELAKKSPGLKYTPSGHGTPIDISDFNDRKTALTALYADFSAMMDPKIKKAAESDDLKLTADVSKDVPKLRALEMAATGSDTQTTDAVKTLASHAQDLLSAKLRLASDMTAKIYDNANTVQNAAQGGSFIAVKPGLATVDKRQLGQIIDLCDQIVPGAQELADAMNYDGLTTVVKQAKQVKAEAQRVLQNDYNNGPTGGTLPPRGP